MLKLFDAIYKGLLIIIALVYVLVAVYFSIGRYYMPQLPMLADDIERYLLDTTGSYWGVKSLHGEWHKLNPALHVGALYLCADDQPCAIDDAVLSFAQLDLRLDVLATLVSREPRLTDLRSQSVDVRLWRDPEGKWQLPGLATTGSGGQLDWLQLIVHLRHVAIEALSAQAQLSADSSAPANAMRTVVLPDVQLALDRYRETRRLEITIAAAPKAALDSTPGTIAVEDVGASDTSASAASEPENTVDADSLRASLTLGRASPESTTSNVFSLSIDTVGALTLPALQANAYLQLQDAALDPWLSLLSSDWQGGQWSGELWASHERGGNWEFRSSIEQAQLSRHDDPNWQLRDMQADLAATITVGEGLSLWWDRGSARWREQQLAVPAAAIDVRYHDRHVQQITLEAPTLDVGQVGEMLLGADVLPAAVVDVLTTLQPRGRLSDLHLSMPNARRAADFLLRAGLHDVAVKPWKSAPGAKGVDGYVEADAFNGYVQLDADRGFEIFFPHVYRQAFALDRAQGRVDWQVADRVVVFGESIAMQAGDERIGGSFYVDVPGPGGPKKDEVNRDDSSSEKPAQKVALSKADANSMHNANDVDQAAPFMTLNIGLVNGAVESLWRFLPYTLPTGLSQWLEQADIAGHVNEGGFLFNGSLRAGESDQRRVALYFDVNDAAITYDPVWPRAEGIDGLVGITDGVTDVEVVRGSVRGLAVERAQVRVDTGSKKRAGSIDVDAAVSGDLGNALELLKHSPVAGMVNGLLDEWYASGDLSRGSLDLSIPLRAGRNTAPTIDFSAHIDRGALDMRNLRLQAKALSGPIAYSSSRGLVSNALSATIWDKPVDVRLGQFDSDDATESGATITDTVKRSSASESSTVSPASTTRIDIDGRFDVADIERWLRQPVLSFMRGSTAATIRVEANTQGSAVNASSDLRGVSIDLPGALAKPSDQQLPLLLQWSLSRPNQPLALRIHERAALQMYFDKFQFRAAHVFAGADESHFAFVEDSGWVGGGDSFPGPLMMGDDRQAIAPYVLITGHQQYFDLAEWIPLVDRYRDAAVRWQSVSRSDDPAAADQVALRIASLRLDAPSAFGQSLSATVVDAQRSELGWLFELENEELKGDILIPDNFIDKPLAADTSASRIGVQLDFLRLQNNVLGQQQDNDFFMDSVPLAINIDELLVDGKQLGSWDVLVSPVSDGINVHDIKGELWGLNISSSSATGLSWSASGDGIVESQLAISASTQNIATFVDGLNHFAGNASRSPITSDTANFDVALTWPGAPTSLQRDRLRGKATVSLSEGQFLRTPDSAENLLRLVGLVNLDTIVRRMRLDFSDLYSDGLSFDSVTAQLDFADNTVSFNDKPIEVKAPSSNFVLSGSANLTEGSIDGELLATLPLATNLPWMAALVGGVPAAAGAYLASKIFEQQVDRFSSAVYRIEGPLDKPEVRFGRLFDVNRKSKNKGSAGEMPSEQVRSADDSILDSDSDTAVESVPAESQGVP